ncbi:hypothetical protein A7U60_g4860 [Sanghuangporus baumii]|uniref:Uncharacterized protein n=1 Tax=Sanghuangporus baumii TaxID=108892 RepID=A0A9Q5HXY5_SANBA|nr:hypothetical protein A7U60_g4860 [Sanghuangporus baumii]
MAPTSSSLGNAARSTLLSSSSIVIPIIVIASSAAGISSVLFFVILAVTSYRRVRAQRAAKSKNAIVPRLVITDTSMFPTSNVVVNGEADLDNVIASFKPIGADLHVPENEVAALDVCNIRTGDEEDEQLFPLPKISRTNCASKITERGRSPYYNGKNVEFDFNSACRLSNQPDFVEAEISSVCGSMETDEPVWWYDFRGQESLDSSSSLSEANKSLSSGSLYSTNSFYNTPAKPKLTTQLSDTRLTALEQIPNNNVGNGNSDHARNTGRIDPVDEVGNESQDTLYDADVLEYCWKLSEDASSMPQESSSPLRNELTDTKNAGRMAPSRSKRRSMRTRASTGAYDQKILENCWRLSDNTSLKSISDTNVIRPTRIRHESAARSVSEACISGPEFSQLQVHDSGYIVYPSKRRLLRRASVK